MLCVSKVIDLTCPDILLTAGRFSWVIVSDQEPLNYKQLKIAFALITVIPKVKHSHINIYEDKHTKKPLGGEITLKHPENAQCEAAQ